LPIKKSFQDSENIFKLGHENNDLKEELRELERSEMKGEEFEN
jgi:hypothetical protein